MSWLEILILTISILGVLLHLIGIYCLKIFSRWKYTQTYLIVHLSICHIFYALLGIIRNGFSESMTDDILNYLALFGQGLNFPFYTVMFSLTLDRFLEIYLHLRYTNSFFVRHKLSICHASWTTMVIYFVTMSILSETIVLNVGLIKTAFRKILMTLSAFVLVTFTIVYGYIFYKIKTGRKRHGQNRRLKIFVPFFIVLSFILFVAIPDVILVFKPSLKLYARLFYRLNVVFDAFVYIFMQPVIRRRIHKSIKRKAFLDVSSFGSPLSSRGDSNENMTSQISIQQLSSVSK